MSPFLILQIVWSAVLHWEIANLIGKFPFWHRLYQREVKVIVSSLYSSSNHWYLSSWYLFLYSMSLYLSVVQAHKKMHEYSIWLITIAFPPLHNSQTGFTHSLLPQAPPPSLLASYFPCVCFLSCSYLYLSFRFNFN